MIGTQEFDVLCPDWTDQVVLSMQAYFKKTDRVG